MSVLVGNCLNIAYLRMVKLCTLLLEESSVSSGMGLLENHGEGDKGENQTLETVLDSKTRNHRRRTLNSKCARLSKRRARRFFMDKSLSIKEIQ